MPAGWAEALRGGAVRAPDGITFAVSAVAGDLAFGQFDGDGHGDRGVGQLDLTTGALTRIASYDQGVSGLGGLAVDGTWVVWEQLDSTSDLSDWSVHAANRATGASRVLATSALPGGGHVAGQQPLPVLRHGIAAWAQPIASGGTAAAQVRAVDLGSGRTWALDTGHVSSPVYAGGYLVWARMDAGGYSFHAVDATTLEPVTLPAPLSRPASVAYLGGSASYLVWSSADATRLYAWRFDQGRGRAYRTADGRHFFQFLQVTGDYLVWYGGLTSSVLDLTTGSGFDLSGTMAASSRWIVAAGPAAAGAATSRLGRIAVSAVTHLRACG